MPTDAKFGLILGLGLVVFITAMFFRKEDSAQVSPTNSATTNQTGQPSDKAKSSTAQLKAIPAKYAPQATGQGQTHVVQDGDTLYSLAQQYYQDESRFVELYQANQDVLSSPRVLVPGTVLTIPEASPRQENPSTFANHVEDTTAQTGSGGRSRNGQSR